MPEPGRTTTATTKITGRQGTLVGDDTILFYTRHALDASSQRRLLFSGTRVVSGVTHTEPTKTRQQDRTKQLLSRWSDSPRTSRSPSWGHRPLGRCPLLPRCGPPLRVHRACTPLVGQHCRPAITNGERKSRESRWSFRCQPCTAAAADLSSFFSVPATCRVH